MVVDLFTVGGTIVLGGIMCGVMWFYGKRQYKEGWNDGFSENLKLRLMDIKDNLANKIEIYHGDDDNN